MTTPSTWPQIRAGLLLLAIGINALSALPAPTELAPEHFDRPTNQEELGSWITLLDTFGIDVEPEWLEQQVIAVSNTWFALRADWIGRPTRFLRRWLGVRQSWALFSRPDTFPTVLTVDVRTHTGDWTEVYRSLHPDHDALGPQLRYRRMRGLYDVSGKPAAPYLAMVQWVSRELLARNPEISSVRVRMLQRHVVRPGEPADPAEKVVHRRVIRRKSP